MEGSYPSAVRQASSAGPPRPSGEPRSGRHRCSFLLLGFDRPTAESAGDRGCRPLDGASVTDPPSVGATVTTGPTRPVEPEKLIARPRRSPQRQRRWVQRRYPTASRAWAIRRIPPCRGEQADPIPLAHGVHTTHLFVGTENRSSHKRQPRHPERRPRGPLDTRLPSPHSIPTTSQERPRILRHESVATSRNRPCLIDTAWSPQ